MTETVTVVVRRQIIVAAPIERAFTVFTERFGDFKPPEHNLLGAPIAETVFEPHVGGNIYDRATDGTECRWARILAYEPALSHEHDWNAYPEFDNERELPATLFVPENTTMDQLNGLRAFLDTFSALYPQLQDIDFRRDVPRLEIPVYMVVGAHEARGRAVLADEWFEMLQAPSKERIVFEHSGHRPSFEEPARFAELMARVKAEISGA